MKEWKIAVYCNSLQHFKKKQTSKQKSLCKAHRDLLESASVSCNGTWRAAELSQICRIEAKIHPCVEISWGSGTASTVALVSEQAMPDQVADDKTLLPTNSNLDYMKGEATFYFRHRGASGKNKIFQSFQSFRNQCHQYKLEQSLEQWDIIPNS